MLHVLVCGLKGDRGWDWASVKGGRVWAFNPDPPFFKCDGGCGREIWTHPHMRQWADVTEPGEWVFLCRECYMRRVTGLSKEPDKKRAPVMDWGEVYQEDTPW